MEIEYKEFTLGMLDQFQNKDEPLLPKVVVSIDGVPLEECSSETQMRAGFKVVRFFMTEIQGIQTLSPSSTRSDGAS